MTVITAPLNGEVRLILAEGLREEETRLFWTKESTEGLEDDQAGDVLDYRGEPFRARRVAQWPVVSWKCSANGLMRGRREKFWSQNAIGTISKQCECDIKRAIEFFFCVSPDVHVLVREPHMCLFPSLSTQGNLVEKQWVYGTTLDLKPYE